ncbi:hypothetical protein [Streptomyces sp.]|uniref:hypothetical protein n=1 Tax=Streptomyces sp. TaxID=1931 RepID=UPI00281122A0|nr:hypothetical protein [Streptomyces sp.]
MGSRVPEVIETLVALARADLGLEGVRICDGPEVTGDTDLDWLVIGFDGDASGDFEAAQTVGGWSDLSGGREEEFQLTVAAIATSGDTDIAAARTRAYEIAERVEAWLRTSPGLGLRSLEAAVAGTRLVQDQTDRGAQVRLLLSVAGRAFT